MSAAISQTCVEIHLLRELADRLEEHVALVSSTLTGAEICAIAWTNSATRDPANAAMAKAIDAWLPAAFADARRDIIAAAAGRVLAARRNLQQIRAQSAGVREFVGDLPRD